MEKIKFNRQVLKAIIGLSAVCAITVPTSLNSAQADPIPNSIQQIIMEGGVPGSVKHDTDLLKYKRDEKSITEDYKQYSQERNFEGNGGGQEPARVPAGPGAAPGEHVAGDVEDDEQLQHQRRAPDDPDQQPEQQPDGLKGDEDPGDPPGGALLPPQVPVDGPGQGGQAAHGAEGDEQAEGQRPHQGDDEELEGLQEALVQGAHDHGQCFQKLVHRIILFLSCGAPVNRPKAEGAKALCFWERSGVGAAAYSWGMMAAWTP